MAKKTVKGLDLLVDSAHWWENSVISNKGELKLLKLNCGKKKIDTYKVHSREYESREEEMWEELITWTELQEDNQDPAFLLRYLF